MTVFPEPVSLRSPRFWLVAALILALGLLPVYAKLAQQPFYVTLFSRIMIYALAAASLNLLIGYAGLISLGHALYLGIGAYAVGLLSFYGVTNGWLHLLAAVAGSLLVSFVTGLICLRTRGMAFIMITLAFAQMFFYLGVSLKQYGGDDGFRLDSRSHLVPFDLASNTTLYYVIFGTLVTFLYLSWRGVHARLGYVLRGIKANERRMKALGYPTTRFKLIAYMISAAVASIAGLLLANLTSYMSPAYGAWTVSGDLVVIAMLGGIGTIIGPVVGALTLLLFEEALSSITTHWMAVLGLAIVVVVITARRGLYGSFQHWSLARERAGR